MQFYFVVSGLKCIGHGNKDNNLQSHCNSPDRSINECGAFNCMRIGRRNISTRRSERETTLKEVVVAYLKAAPEFS
jgi:hypothetical protein